MLGMASRASGPITFLRGLIKHNPVLLMASKALTIHGGATNANVWKSIIAARYAGVEIKRGEDFQMGVTNKTPEYLAKNPFGLVPVMDTPEGPLYESNTCARYVARAGNSKIYGGSNYQISLIDQGLDVIRSLEPAIAGWMYPILGYFPFDKTAVERSKDQALNRWLKPINNHLGSKKFIAGDSVTLADICLYCCLINPLKNVMGPDARDAIPNIMEWFARCSAEPNFKEVVGEVEFCKEEPKEPVKRQ